MSDEMATLNAAMEALRLMKIERDALRAENERLKAEVEGRGNLLLRWLMDNHLGIESDDDTFVPETLECLGMTDEDLESVAESGDY